MVVFMEKTCENCGKTFDRPPSLIGRFCSSTCAYSARRKPLTEHRRIRYLPEHPLAGHSGLVSEARVVLFARIGPGAHRCHWCGGKVRWRKGQRGNLVDALVADHVDNNPLNDAPDNVVASCGSCNGNRTQKIKGGEAFVVNANGTRARAVEKACAACAKVFLAIPAQVRSGRGRFCSRSCARSAPRRTKTAT
jgi:hypothetical protein